MGHLTVALATSKILLCEGVLLRGDFCVLKQLLVKGHKQTMDATVAVGTHLRSGDTAAACTALLDLRTCLSFAVGSMLDALFDECTLHYAKVLSRIARDRAGLLGDNNLIYGEVDYQNFCKVLRVATSCLVGSADSFVDLGSGSGRAVFAACLTCSFRRVEGIELVAGLHAASLGVCARFDGGFKQQLFGNKQAPVVRVSLGSFLDHDWSYADVVFANSTCFDDCLLENIAAQVDRLRTGAVFVSFTKAVPSPLLVQRRRFRLSMSWGPATVFVACRVANSEIDSASGSPQLLPSEHPASSFTHTN